MSGLAQQLLSTTVKRLLLPLMAALSLHAAALADDPAVRVGVLKFGTVNWELNAVEHHNIDAANGIDMQVSGYANGNAAKIAFQGGEVNVIVSDWIWVARQRADGKNLAFFPYSLAVG